MSQTAAPERPRQSGASRWTGGDRRPPSRRMLAVVAALVVLVAIAAALTRIAGGGSDHEPSPPASAGTRLAWAPPRLSQPTTVRITPRKRDLVLDAGRDYVVQMPRQPLLRGMTIRGGHDVVLIGGAISIPADHPGRGLSLKSQTGTVHVEGLSITGAGLTEGIDLDQGLGGVVQLENLRVDAPHGSRSGNHADVIQSWAGPRILRIDRLSGRTHYQGFFLLPNQFGKQGPPERFDLRHVDLQGFAGSAYMLWRDGGTWPLEVHDVYVHRPDQAKRDMLLWPKGHGKGTGAWPRVRIGTPPHGPFVPRGVAGPGYRSPGYA